MATLNLVYRNFKAMTRKQLISRRTIILWKCKELKSFSSLNQIPINKAGKIDNRKSKVKLMKLLALVCVGAAVPYYFGKDLTLRQCKVYVGGIGRFFRSLTVGMTISLDYWWCFRQYDEANKLYNEKLRDCHLRSANRIVNCCLNNGGLYVKLGQGLVSFNYLLPKEYIENLVVLQDKALSRQVHEIQRLFIEEFGRSPDQVFQTFDENPIAAGSLAQVHLATTKDGEKVAVKVQYIDLQDRYDSDIWTVKTLLDIVGWMHPNFGFKWALNDLKYTLEQELDFVNEAHNAERCQADLKHLKFVHIPKVYWDYTNKRVLTAEYIDGCKISDIAKIREMNLKLSDVDKKLVHMFGEQIFHTGFVHADPHPGNIFVRVAKESGKAELVLLDHGLYQKLPDKTRESLCYLWKNIVLNDKKLMMKYCQQLDVNDYKLFCEILLQRPIERPRLKLPNKLTENDVNYMREMAKNRFDEVMDAIKCMPKPLLLVFRNLNTVRAIVAEHGHTIDRHILMAHIATRQTFSRAMKLSFLLNRWERFVFNCKLRFESFTLLAIRSYFKLLYMIGRAPKCDDLFLI